MLSPCEHRMVRCMEHRWGHRVEIGIDVGLVYRPSVVGAGRLRNVSISGAFIETTLRPPLLARLLVHVDEGHGSHSLVRLPTARVVRQDATGIAVEWCTLAPACVNDLQKLALRQMAASDGNEERAHRVPCRVGQ